MRIVRNEKKAFKRQVLLKSLEQRVRNVCRNALFLGQKESKIRRRARQGCNESIHMFHTRSRNRNGLYCHIACQCVHNVSDGANRITAPTSSGVSMRHLFIRKGSSTHLTDFGCVRNNVSKSFILEKDIGKSRSSAISSCVIAKQAAAR